MEPNASFKLAVKAILLDSQSRCLLLRRSPANRSVVGQWEWPGGKVDPGEEFADAVVRETREECGLEVALTGVGGVTSFEMPVGQIVLLCMEVRRTGGEICLSHEHDDFAWVPLAQLPRYALTEPAREFMHDYPGGKKPNMNPDNASESLTRPELASQLSDADWVAMHVPRYAHAAPAYAEYESFLKTVLKELTAKVAPLAIVETRAKRMASFAEKILRKRQAYQDPRDPLPPDPLIRLTDLCGGRVVCQTAEQVRAVCQLIENAFVVDWANSEDVSQRLKPAEFGYRSVHYIVQPEPERLRNTGVNTPVPRILLGFAPEELGAHAAAIPLKCEIQVRTLLEHASSDLGHDTIYKTELKIPDRIKRQYAALAAVLEGADREIERLLMTLAEFRSNYGAWHERGQVEKEIAHARVLLGLPDDRLATSHKVSIALRAARLALSIGRHELAVTILEPHTGQHHPGLHRVLGQALVELHWHEPHHPVFERGRHHLEQATESSLTDAETLSLRAECAAHLDDDVEARRLFALAVEADGAEPLTLARYLEFETAHSGNDNPLRLASPMIRAGIVRAQRQIEARANLASAWSAIAVFHLFLGEPFPALDALAQVIRLCEKSTQDAVAKSAHPCAAGRALLRLRDTVRRLRCLRERLEGFDWFERLVLLALATKMGDQRARAELLGLATWAADPAEKHFSADQRTVFFAGGCSTEVEPSMASFRPQLQRACS